MKKRLICMLTVLVLLVSLFPAANAAEKPTFSGDCSAAVKWTLDPEEGVLTISGTGPIPDYSYDGSAPWYAYRSRIFKAILSEGITAIGSYAFHECYLLTSVEAADSTLSSIGTGAMNNCAALETFTFKAADAITVGDDAFFGCEKLAELDLGAKSAIIGAGAFEGCTALTRVDMPTSLGRLEEKTFSGCEALTEISLPADLSYIGKDCFRGCVNLGSVVFPAGLKEIGRYAYQGCGNASFTFTGDAPAFAPANDISSTFLPAAVLHIPYGAKGWSWPICKGYGTAYVFPSLDDVFTDLAKNAWYIPSVQHVYYTGLMNGMSADKFAPGNPMTRGQLVTVLYRIAGEPEVADANPFTDVKENAYYSKAVRWAQQNGIVTGVTETTFVPDRQVSREQMCTILYRYAAFLKLDLSKRDTLQDFSDNGKLSSYARDPMGWCVAMGFINGKPGGLLDPKGTATRAEIAKVLTAFDSYLAAERIAAEDDWEDEFKPEDPGPDIDREDPLYLYARIIFDDINKVRTDKGLNELQWNDYIYEAASTRAQEISGENSFGHTRPDGSSYSTVFTQYNITCTTRNEIIAHGYTTSKDLVDVWASASSTSPVISAVVYNSAAVGVYQVPPAQEGEAGKYYYTLLVIG